MIGSQTLLLVLGVVLLLFGGKKLPELAGSLGKSMREFKKGVDNAAEKDTPQAATSAPAVTAAPTRDCPGCKAPVQVEWAHCPQCGASVAAAAPVSQT